MYNIHEPSSELNACHNQSSPILLLNQNLHNLAACQEFDSRSSICGTRQSLQWPWPSVPWHSPGPGACTGACHHMCTGVRCACRRKLHGGQRTEFQVSSHQSCDSHAAEQRALVGRAASLESNEHYEEAMLRCTVLCRQRAPCLPSSTHRKPELWSRSGCYLAHHPGSGARQNSVFVPCS